MSPMSSPLFPLIFFALLGTFLLEAYAARRRRAGLPVFDHRRMRDRLASMPSLRYPNLRETLTLAVLGAAIWATLIWGHVVP
jgi:hypothetical protein